MPNKNKQSVNYIKHYKELQQTNNLVISGLFSITISSKYNINIGIFINTVLRVQFYNNCNTLII